MPLPAIIPFLGTVDETIQPDAPTTTNEGYKQDSLKNENAIDLEVPPILVYADSLVSGGLNTNDMPLVKLPKSTEVAKLNRGDRGERFHVWHPDNLAVDIQEMRDPLEAPLKATAHVSQAAVKGKLDTQEDHSFRADSEMSVPPKSEAPIHAEEALSGTEILETNSLDKLQIHDRADSGEMAKQETAAQPKPLDSMESLVCHGNPKETGTESSADEAGVEVLSVAELDSSTKPSAVQPLASAEPVLHIELESAKSDSHCAELAIPVEPDFPGPDKTTHGITQNDTPATLRTTGSSLSTPETPDAGGGGVYEGEEEILFGTGIPAPAKLFADLTPAPRAFRKVSIKRPRLPQTRKALSRAVPKDYVVLSSENGTRIIKKANWTQSNEVLCGSLRQYTDEPRWTSSTTIPRGPRLATIERLGPKPTPTFKARDVSLASSTAVLAAQLRSPVDSNEARTQEKGKRSITIPEPFNLSTSNKLTNVTDGGAKDETFVFRARPMPSF